MDDGPAADEEALPSEEPAPSPAKPVEEPAAEPAAAPEAAAPEVAVPAATPLEEPAAPAEEPAAAAASGGKKPVFGAKRKGMAVGAEGASRLWWVVPLLVGAGPSPSTLPRPYQPHHPPTYPPTRRSR